jgi:hypothetical protein
MFNVAIGIVTLGIVGIAGGIKAVPKGAEGREISRDGNCEVGVVNYGC